MANFGTGYSSLCYLLCSPFSMLKIDRSLIDWFSEGKADIALVNAVISMAHSLEMKVVATGVETQAQLAHLAAQGCDFAQGSFISKPISAAEMSRLMESEFEELIV